MLNDKKSTLLIEPDKILARQTAEYLSSRGFAVRNAYSAQEAIVMVDDQAPDIIIMEILLTKHSGVEFLYEFRSYVEWRNIPVIVLSRIGQSELQVTKKTIKDLGINLILYKPDVRLSDIYDHIEKILSLQDIK